MLCCDVQVVLKVIKHCQEEGSSSELVTGILVGLVVGTSLEITNCFPLPKDDDHEDESMSLYSTDDPLPILYRGAWAMGPGERGSYSIKL